MTEAQDEALDDSICDAIDAMREEHHACNPDQLSIRMDVNRTLLAERLAHLYRAGRVEWTTIVGSLRTIRLVEEDSMNAGWDESE
jgi:hypothetical protein